MRNHIYSKFLILVLFLINLLPIAYSGYSYWDGYAVTSTEQINLGEWRNYLLTYDFSEETIASLEADGAVSRNFSKWDIINGVLTNTANNTEIYIPFSASEYTITTTAAVTAENNGGLGIFFETDASNPRKANGYVLQMDKTSSDGAVLIVERVNGVDSAPVWSVTNADSSSIPAYSVDPNWWTSSHNITLVVSIINSNTKVIHVYIDSNEIGSYQFTSTSSGTVYTGFDVWRTGSSFYSIEIY